jgi:FkbM family methyltransferase
MANTGRPEDDTQMRRSLRIFLGLRGHVEVVDVGASCIAESPVYRRLIEHDAARLSAFEGDARHVAQIRSTYGDQTRIFPCFLGDGAEHTLHLATEKSGMSSLLRPDARALRFFNGFERFGKIHAESRIPTCRLDDVQGLPEVDFIKMDIQGSELEVLRHGTDALKSCVAAQLEVSFVTLYENQPTFGAVDLWMRSQGFTPHRFLDVKRWSIAPTLRDENFRIPFNQLLEADIVYVRHLLEPEKLSAAQLRKATLLAHFCFESPDLAVHFILELERRNEIPRGSHKNYAERHGDWTP